MRSEALGIGGIFSGNGRCVQRFCAINLGQRFIVRGNVGMNGAEGGQVAKAQEEGQ